MDVVRAMRRFVEGKNRASVFGTRCSIGGALLWANLSIDAGLSSHLGMDAANTAASHALTSTCASISVNQYSLILKS